MFKRFWNKRRKAWENLQRSLTRSEDNRLAATQAVANFTEKVGALADHMRTEQSLMRNLAENQVGDTERPDAVDGHAANGTGTTTPAADTFEH